MICCSLASLLAALTGWRTLRALAPLTFLAAALFAALHVDHYAARARLHDRALMAEILAQPFCGGAQRASP
jgi:hypothetical protein